jgi:hypothetical protein
MLLTQAMCIIAQWQVAELDACTLREAAVSRCGAITTTTSNSSNIEADSSSSSSDAQSALARAAGHLAALDLKSNLISDWAEVRMYFSIVNCNHCHSTRVI